MRASFIASAFATAALSALLLSSAGCSAGGDNTLPPASDSGAKTDSAAESSADTGGSDTSVDDSSSTARPGQDMRHGNDNRVREADSRIEQRVRRHAGLPRAGRTTGAVPGGAPDLVIRQQQAGASCAARSVLRPARGSWPGPTGSVGIALPSHLSGRRDDGPGVATWPDMDGDEHARCPLGHRDGSQAEGDEQREEGALSCGGVRDEGGRHCERAHQPTAQSGGLHRD